MATPVAGRRRRAAGASEIDQYFQAAGAEAERRIRLFRLAWDFLGSELGGRGELYERFYLSDSWRMTALAYNIADKSFPESLVEQFLRRLTPWRVGALITGGGTGIGAAVGAADGRRRLRACAWPAAGPSRCGRWRPELGGLAVAADVADPARSRRR